MLRYRLRAAARTPFPCPRDVNPTLHALLVQRGIDSEDAARRFLNPKPEHLVDPMRLSSMPEAVARIRRALEGKEPICVYGDYDVDGVSASALLSHYLRAQGGQVEVYLPSRHTEGYGLNESALRAIAGRCRLLVTVDCGVTSVELIALAKSMGLDCIVTDHHRPAEILPDCPVVNPLLNGYPFPYLCGAGVAFKLVEALGGRDAAMDYVDIAALATVADVVSLTGENRVIVKLGLDRMNACPRPGLQALIEVASLSEKKIVSSSVAFQLAPRLNAGGRIGSARRSYDLLLSPTLADARPIAEELEQENRARKDIETQILTEAEEQLKDFDFPAHRCLVLAGQDWNPGVIGLAASRLVEKYHYPAILLSDRDGVLTGSCRSIPGVDIHAALTAVKDHLVRYGGHKQAAGLTIHRSELEGFRADLDAWLRANVSPVCYIPEKEYDMIVAFDALTEGFVAGLDALQPTGEGNPAPVLRAAPYVYDARGVGLDGAHLRLLLSENGVQRTGIFFRAGHLAGALPKNVEILYTPKLNTYMGRTSVQVELKAINPADVLSEIDAKIPEEDDLQREFLTDMLYNNTIDLFTPSAEPLSLDGLGEMLGADPQGTLILAGDLDTAKRILESVRDALPDLCIRSLPEDPRAFNALAVYPPKGRAGAYRRVVLAGLPAGCFDFEGAKVYRLDARASWLRALPDVDELREIYKGVRQVARGRVRWSEAAMVTHMVAEYSTRCYVGAAAGLLALRDMALIEYDPLAKPPVLNLNKMSKTDPESSAVWRALQAWRTEG